MPNGDFRHRSVTFGQAWPKVTSGQGVTERPRADFRRLEVTSSLSRGDRRFRRPHSSLLAGLGQKCAKPLQKCDFRRTFVTSGSLLAEVMSGQA